MKRLVLNDNKFSDEGGAALLECFHNIEELEMLNSEISHEMTSKMKERASESSVQLELSPFLSMEQFNNLIEKEMIEDFYLF